MAPYSRFGHCNNKKRLIAITSISIFILLSVLSYIGSKHQEVLNSSPHTKRTIFGHMKRHFYIYCVEVDHIYRSVLSYPTILISRIAHCVRYITRHFIYEFRYLLYLINIPLRMLRFLLKPIKHVLYLHDSRALARATASHKHWSAAFECASRKTDSFFSILIRLIRVIFYIIDNLISWTDAKIHTRYIPNGAPLINYQSSTTIIIGSDAGNEYYPNQDHTAENEEIIVEEFIQESIDPETDNSQADEKIETTEKEESKPSRNLIRKTDYNVINEIYHMIITKLKLLVKASEKNIACQ